MQRSDKTARNDRHRTGRLWEDRAARYLQRHGLRVLSKRYRCRLGELDLVCLDEGTLVVVEVRARRRGTWVPAAETIDVWKQRKLVLATRHFLMTHPDWSTHPLRFDVFSATGIDTAEPTVRWIRNAFEAGAA